MYFLKKLKGIIVNANKFKNKKIKVIHNKTFCFKGFSYFQIRVDTTLDKLYFYKLSLNSKEISLKTKIKIKNKELEIVKIKYNTK